MIYSTYDNRVKQNKPAARILCADQVIHGMLGACLAPYFELTDGRAALTVVYAGSLPDKIPGAAIIIGGSDEEVETEGGRRVFLRRPVDIEELVRCALQLTVPHSVRKSSGEETGYLYETGTRTVFLADRSVRLTETEAKLFVLLAEKLGETIPRLSLTQKLWPGSTDTNVCDVYVCYLRKKLEILAGKGAILSQRGQGYLLTKPDIWKNGENE